VNFSCAVCFPSTSSKSFSDLAGVSHLVSVLPLPASDTRSVTPAVTFSCVSFLPTHFGGGLGFLGVVYLGPRRVPLSLFPLFTSVYFGHGPCPARPFSVPPFPGFSTALSIGLSGSPVEFWHLPLVSHLTRPPGGPGDYSFLPAFFRSDPLVVPAMLLSSFRFFFLRGVTGGCSAVRLCRPCPLSFFLSTAVPRLLMASLSGTLSLSPRRYLLRFHSWETFFPLLLLLSSLPWSPRSPPTSSDPPPPPPAPPRDRAGAVLEGGFVLSSQPAPRPTVPGLVPPPPRF